jgi:hypothetical protein
MALRQRETVTFRDAEILYPNFSGTKKQYNAEGDRNFNILLDEALAKELEANGWNVKPRKRSEDEEYGPPDYQLKVAVSYKVRAPRVWLISSGGRNMLGEGIVGVLDELDPVKVDFTISAYDWEMNGNTGRKAYLQSMFYTMYEDELELEYANVPILGTNGGDVGTPEITSGTISETDAGARLPYDHEGTVVN